MRWEYFFYVKGKIFSRNIPPGLIVLSTLYAQHTYAVRQGCARQRNTRPHYIHATPTKERADLNNLIGSLAVVHLPKSAGLDFSTLKYKSMRKYAKTMNMQFFLKRRSFVQYAKSRRKKEKILAFVRWRVYCICVWLMNHTAHRTGQLRRLSVAGTPQERKNNGYN